MLFKKDMLPEEEIRQLQERLKVLDSGLSLPKSLSAEALHQKLTPEDCRSFREAGHPDFMYWRRYAGMVASFIIVLAGLVLFTSGRLDFSRFASGSGAMAEAAAMDFDEAEGDDALVGYTVETVEEEAPAAEPASSRSRLYAASYDDISAALHRTVRRDYDGGYASDGKQQLMQQETGDAALSLAAPDSSWQKELTDSPDELPDVVKSDGTYLYYYAAPAESGQEGKIHIVEGESLELVSTIRVGACDGAELFIRDGRLILISQNLAGTSELLYDASVLVTGEGTRREGQNQSAAADERSSRYGVTSVSVYDLSDLSDPTLVRSFLQDGVYQTSRLSGSRLCLVTRKELDPQLWSDEEALLCDLAPVLRDSLSGGSYTLESSMVAIAPNSTADVYTTVSLLDIASDAQPVTNGVLGAQQSYYTDRSLYFCYDAQSDASGDPAVGIVRMNLGQELTVSTQTTLKGSLEQPFAINRLDDVLRVGTVSADPATGAAYSNIYLLNDSFQTIGSIEGIGSGEKVEQIRFVGSYAYITSDRESRPVLGLNLAEPHDPIILGQLDLQALPENFRILQDDLLVGISSTQEGLLLSGSDFANGPMGYKAEAALPGNNGTSAALGDYRAILCSSDRQLIGIPAICRQSTTTGGNRLLYWGYFVYSVTEQGLERVSIITHADTLSESTGSQRRDINRGRIVGNRLYTFSGSMIKALDLTTMQEAGTLQLS